MKGLSSPEGRRDVIGGAIKRCLIRVYSTILRLYCNTREQHQRIFSRFSRVLRVQTECEDVKYHNCQHLNHVSQCPESGYARSGIRGRSRSEIASMRPRTVQVPGTGHEHARRSQMEHLLAVQVTRTQNRCLGRGLRRHGCHHKVWRTAMPHAAPLEREAGEEVGTDCRRPPRF